ncbi:MAG: host attachment protein [Candidatus Jidaibacter sp.]|nr:host attachment protein [Candidatus Jidaibacter sp.]
MITPQKITWIVVADGSKARLYSSYKSRHNLKLINKLESDKARVHSHSLGSDKPHGIFELNTPESKVDLHHQEEQHFSRQITAILNQGATANEFQSLILIAPPKFLGYLRHTLSVHATILLSKEIHKDLTSSKEEELKEHIWGF